MAVDLKIKVTKDVLERSKYCSRDPDIAMNNCAIAVVIKDIFPFSVVGIDDIRPFFNKQKNNLTLMRISIPLPIEAKKFVGEFDICCFSSRPLLPEIEFTITIPDEVIAQIDIEAIRPMLENHPTLELV